jgi:hypothetical protein
MKYRYDGTYQVVYYYAQQRDHGFVWLSFVLLRVTNQTPLMHPPTTIITPISFGYPICWTGSVCGSCFRWCETYSNGGNCCRCSLGATESTFLFANQSIARKDYFNNHRHLDGEGSVDFYPNFIPISKANIYMKQLLNKIPWELHAIQVKGGEQNERRWSSFHGDSDVSYTYGNKRRTTNKWVQPLTTIKQTLEKEFNVKFNSCLVNLYVNGIHFIFLFSLFFRKPND